MHADAEEATGPVLGGENDPRVTRLGRVAARHAARRAAAAVERAARRHELRRPAAGAAGVRARATSGTSRATPSASSVRPGLTGYAQVNGEYHTSADDQAQVRPRLHPQPLALARPANPVRDREGHAHAAGRVARCRARCRRRRRPAARRRAARPSRRSRSPLSIERHADRHRRRSACSRSSASPLGLGRRRAARRSTACWRSSSRVSRCQHAGERRIRSRRPAGCGRCGSLIALLRRLLVAARSRDHARAARPLVVAGGARRRRVRHRAALHRRRLVPRRARPADAGPAARAGRATATRWSASSGTTSPSRTR